MLKGGIVVRACNKFDWQMFLADNVMFVVFQFAVISDYFVQFRSLLLKRGEIKECAYISILAAKFILQKF